MKYLLFLLFTFFLSLNAEGQSTEDYFSRPGLNINADHTGCCGSAHPSSYTYAYKTSICGEEVLVFPRNDGIGSIHLQVTEKKVYIIYPSCHKDLYYDFGLNPGDTVREGFYKDYILIAKYETMLLTGEMRIRFDLRNLFGHTASWIEGIGDINRGLRPENDKEGYDIFVCARDSTGELWINPDQYENCAIYGCPSPRPEFEYVRNNFTISFINKSLFASNYLWDFGNGKVSTEKNPVYSYPQAGCYIVTLMTKNECFPEENEIAIALPLCISSDWEKLDSISFGNNFKLRVFSDHLWFLYSINALYKSSDEGMSWQSLTIPSAGQGITRIITDIEMYGDLKGIITCGHYGAQSDQKAVLITSDGGINWEERAPGTYFILKLVLGNHGEAWICGGEGYFKSLDFGETWVDLNNTLSENLYEIFNINDTVLVALSYLGLQPWGQYYLSKSIDAGEHWVKTELPPFINKVYFVNANQGFGYSTSNKGVYKTEDSGLNWALTAPEIYVDDIQFYNDETGWISDQNGIVYHTTDGMNSYQKTNCGGESIHSLNPLSTQSIIGVSKNKIISYKGSGGYTCDAADQDDDGFSDEADCNDTNPEINPEAVEIPDNGIDEDCDGNDLVTQVYFLAGKPITIYPNPVSKTLLISSDFQTELTIRLYDFTGKLLYMQKGNQSIDINTFPAGIYIVEIFSETDNEKLIEKIVVVK